MRRRGDKQHEIGFKQCWTCHFTRQLRMFNRRQTNPDGHENHCRYCTAEKKKQREAVKVKLELARLAKWSMLMLLLLGTPAAAQVFVDSHALLIDHHGTPGIFLCQDAACEAFAWHAMHWHDGTLTFNSYGYGPIDLVDGGADIFRDGGPYLFKIDDLIFDVPYVPSEPYTLGVTINGAFGWLTFAEDTMTNVMAYGPTGDYQLDGDVDGRDLLAWQRNTQLGDLATWQGDYHGAAEISTPEPETAVLLVSGLLLTLSLRPKR